MENVNQYYQDANAIGSEHFYRLNQLTPWAIATDGAYLMFQKLRCFWLFDAVVSHISSIKKNFPDVFSDGFLVARLVRNEAGSGAVLTIEDGNDHVLKTQNIPFTDILQNVLLFVEYNGEGWTLLLPSEH
jgi:hypothetical protein